ncbi:hypothetical protein JCM9140_613 [Halalkalibacter wakoensis JCM 9140]|uniref:Uncharacterized protein n=1 Tax=Halalkalibacter wakoensis JCM 9140 TaxID=1236970 RepID=W4PZX4_9BACI|nr:dual specificity protein phosphatase family protein [Halalkalibacter wakoensis]GAE24669.1 hypothetical protein JCM9140_613 [Halalkalibacter wakoensis JCM 9140]
MCGEKEVSNITDSELITYVVDLRAEATDSVVPNEQIDWIHIPLVDGERNQLKNLEKAISFVVEAFKDNKRVVLH